MDLQVSVFLLFILFTAGHSLDCYDCTSSTGSCANQMVKSCPSGFSQCASSTIVTQVGGITSTEKTKSCVAVCQSGSINVNNLKTSTSCCDTSLCNANVPDPLPNGNTCYTCDDQSCSKILSCLGTEDRCMTATETFGNQSTAIKGCLSKSVCDVAEAASCCEGNLCNGAQRVTQSFLFLCCSLLSYFLLH